ncbi:MAG: KamA family radical SAM protein [Limnochordaceae bacterium]|nr:KamA family radical SAM protein [Limnochordaceae bacterium]
MSGDDEKPGGTSWKDWRWQFRHRVRTAEQLAQHTQVTPEMAQAIEACSHEFRFAITPYYLSLIDWSDPNDPIRRQAIPSADELEDPLGGRDPLHEEDHSPVKGLVHMYPDRVAFLVTADCAIYCRHCTRKRFVGKGGKMTDEDVDRGIEYIRRTPAIRDVLITGGDPLVASDAWLEGLISRIRAIPHVEIIRIGTRMPVTMPQRITQELCDMLQKYHPIWVNTHFNHPREITPESAAAVDRLLRAGIPVGNQTVLLKGVNDDPAVMRELVQGLLKIRVRPYYLYQCDMLRGTAHFRTPIETGLEIIRALQGWTTGFAVPTFVVDSPIGKIPIMPQNLVERGDGYIVLRNYEGRTVRLPNPSPSLPEQAVTAAAAVSTNGRASANGHSKDGAGASGK